MLTEAHEDGEKVAAFIFSQARDVEEIHAGLYKRAMDHVIWERSTMYQNCTVCGYVAQTGGARKTALSAGRIGPCSRMWTRQDSSEISFVVCDGI